MNLEADHQIARNVLCADLTPILNPCQKECTAKIPNKIVSIDIIRNKSMTALNVVKESIAHRYASALMVFLDLPLLPDLHHPVLTIPDQVNLASLRLIHILTLINQKTNKSATARVQQL